MYWLTQGLWNQNSQHGSHLVLHFLNAVEEKEKGGIPNAYFNI